MISKEQRFNFTTQALNSLPYLLHLPEGYDEREEWPLILFLHGAGERGDDLSKLRTHALPGYLEAGGELPAVVVSPQCPEGRSWSSFLPLVHALVLELIEAGRVDPHRVTATGASMGGTGVYELVGQYPGVFAAVAPVCPPLPMLFFTPAAAEVPLWVFHGEEDPLVPLEHSRRLVAATEAAGGGARLTVYPGVGHGAWTPAYGEGELLGWLLEQELV